MAKKKRERKGRKIIPLICSNAFKPPDCFLMLKRRWLISTCTLIITVLPLHGDIYRDRPFKIYLPTGNEYWALVMLKGLNGKLKPQAFQQLLEKDILCNVRIYCLNTLSPCFEILWYGPGSY